RPVSGGELTYEATRCSPDGGLGFGEACLPGCFGSQRDTCEEDMACVDSPGGDEVCRPLCSGSAQFPECDDGLCFRRETSDDTQFGICRGECNPFDPLPCEGNEVCSVRSDDPIPRCLPNLGEPMFGCTDGEPCGEYTICIPPEEANGCSGGWCCMDLCEPLAGDDCPPEYTCVPISDIQDGPDVPMGFCNPP
ncbi:MAG: hypothetical protein KUG77_09645, partial [Nannocystaceae bacterium]|nr:hypothetical protein [Nannocystaceae bacterium]